MIEPQTLLSSPLMLHMPMSSMLLRKCWWSLRSKASGEGRLMVFLKWWSALSVSLRQHHIPSTLFHSTPYVLYSFNFL
jgi:hypothetical protein